MLMKIDPGRWRSFAIGAALAAITVAVFGRVASHEFIEFDDQGYVVVNPLVQAGLTVRGVGEALTTFRADNWHPLTWLSLMADRQFFGPGPAGFHITNLVLHVASVLLLFAALQHMTGAAWRSGLVAALFAIHPLHVESVAWVAERKDVLSTFFWMLVLWSYSRYARAPGVKWYAIVCSAFVLGLMAKPMLVTLPCVLLLLDYWPLGRWKRAVSQGSGEVAMRASQARAKSTAKADPQLTLSKKTAGGALIVEKLPLFALATASCVVTLLAQRSAIPTLSQLPLSERLANCVMAYVAYLGQTFWPADLACFYPYQRIKWTSPTSAPIFAALLLVAMTFVALALRGRPWLLVGWLWFLGTLVPVIGLVQVGTQSRADRYTYSPLIGIFLIAAWSIPWPNRTALRGLTVATVGAVIAALMAISYRQVGYWKNTYTLFEHAIAVTQGNWRAHVDLAIAYEKHGEPADAERHYRASVAEGMNPSDAQSHAALANLALGRGDLEQAVLDARNAILHSPDSADAHGLLGLALARQQKFDDAIRQFQMAVGLAPRHPGYRLNLASALADAGRSEEAADAHNDLGTLLSRTGETAAAVKHFREALRLNPAHSGARSNLRRALEGQ